MLSNQLLDNLTPFEQTEFFAFEDLAETKFVEIIITRAYERAVNKWLDEKHSEHLEIQADLERSELISSSTNAD